MSTKISISFPVVIADSPGAQSYVDGVPHVQCYARSQTAALKTLKTLLEERIRQALAETRQHMISCKDGHVLVAEAKGGVASYTIHGPDRKHAGYCSLGQDGTFEAAVAAARGHAEQIFGGVAWEND